MIDKRVVRDVIPRKYFLFLKESMWASGLPSRDSYFATWLSCKVLNNGEDISCRWKSLGEDYLC